MEENNNVNQNNDPKVENDTVQEVNSFEPSVSNVEKNNDEILEESPIIVEKEESVVEEESSEPIVPVVENKKKSPKWILLIIVILILGVGAYFLYNIFLSKGNNETNKENNNISTPSDNISTPSDIVPTSSDDATTPSDDVVAELNIPTDLSKYNVLHWDYNKLYDYYFKMGNDESINIDPKFKDVKIENNKLFWNVDSNWISDPKITDDIMYFNMTISVISGDEFIAVTKSGKIYYITIDQDRFVCTEEYTTSSDDISCDENTYNSLTNEIFQEFKYKELNANGSISNVSQKTFSQCGGWDEYYFEIDKKIYALEDKLIDINTYLDSDKKVTGLANGCSDAYDMALIIETNGTIKNIIDENNNLINVKHYIILTKNENDYYDIIIDKNDNLYIVNRNAKQQKIKDKVLNFEFNIESNGKEKLKIDLEKTNDIVK